MTPRSTITHATMKWLFHNAPVAVRANVEARDKWCDHLEREQLDMLRQVEMPHLKKALEEFPEMTAPKTLTIFNSLYHVPQIGLGHGPYVWVWRKGEWHRASNANTFYPHEPEPSRMWSYTDPGLRYHCTGDEVKEYAYIEVVSFGNITYHELTDENLLKMPGYMREKKKTRFEHKSTIRHPLHNNDEPMLEQMSHEGWELVSVAKDGDRLRYYWKRPAKG